MQHRKTLMLVLTALFAALTAIGAFFKIPFALAAISLQFLFTAMAGILLGAGYGALSQAVYVLIGLVGVPIFALGGGFSYVLQPTFGFLLWMYARDLSGPAACPCCWPWPCWQGWLFCMLSACRIWR